MPTLHELGEDVVVRRLSRRLATGGEVLAARGDDCAVTAPGPADRLVWTADTMVEGVHFRWWPAATPADIGYKLAATNLSDLASKGAAPWSAMISVAAPPDAPVALAEGLYDGLAEGLAPLSAGLLGGDLVRAGQWVLTLTLVGRLAPGLAIAARAAARPGMNVFVTGAPGESAQGLRLLESLPGPPSAALDRRLVARHLRPTARLAEGAALVRALGPGLAMMDVSDGVARDAGRMAAEAGVAIVLEHDALPLGEDLLAGAGSAEAAREAVLLGGEDYELLFCCEASEVAVRRVLADAGCATRVHRIARVEPGQGVWIEQGGARRPWTSSGFEHF